MVCSALRARNPAPNARNQSFTKPASRGLALQPAPRLWPKTGQSCLRSSHAIVDVLNRLVAAMVEKNKTSFECNQQFRMAPSIRRYTVVTFRQNALECNPIYKCPRTSRHAPASLHLTHRSSAMSRVFRATASITSRCCRTIIPPIATTRARNNEQPKPATRRGPHCSLPEKERSHAFF